MQVVEGAEQPYFARFVLVGLHALKNGLAVVQRRVGRTHRNRGVGHDLRLLPRPIAVVDYQHVVGKGLAEFKFAHVQLRQLRGRGALGANGEGVKHGKLLSVAG